MVMWRIDEKAEMELRRTVRSWAVALGDVMVQIREYLWGWGDKNKLARYFKRWGWQNCMILWMGEKVREG